MEAKNRISIKVLNHNFESEPIKKADPQLPSCRIPTLLKADRFKLSSMLPASLLPKKLEPFDMRPI